MFTGLTITYLHSCLWLPVALRIALVFWLIRGRFFAPKGWHVASIWVKFGVEESAHQISPTTISVSPQFPGHWWAAGSQHLAKQGRRPTLSFIQQADSLVFFTSNTSCKHFRLLANKLYQVACRVVTGAYCMFCVSWSWRTAAANSPQYDCLAAAFLPF